MISPTPRERAQTAVRDHLSNERTFLAWVRTAVTFVGLGFAVERLVADDGLGRALGVAMIVVGGAMMVPALVSFRRTARAIVEGDYRPPLAVNVVLTAVVVGGAAALVAFVLLAGS